MALTDFLSHEFDGSTGTKQTDVGRATSLGGGLINTAAKAAQKAAMDAVANSARTGLEVGTSISTGLSDTSPPPTTNSVSRGGSGGGGGGSSAGDGGGGGGVEGTIDPVSDPTPAGGEETGDTTVDEYTEEQIAAALAAIEAKFGMTKEELLADKSYAGLAYKRLIGELRRVRRQAVEGAQQDALRRGIFDSGIHAEQQAQVQQSFAEQQSAAAAERQQRLDSINQALAQLQAQEEAAKAAREAEIRREALLAEAS